MTIDVMVGSARTSISKSVFSSLLENSVANTYAAYEKALEKSSITFSDLVDLARHGDIPYTLFFAPLALVEAQIEAKTKKLLDGLNKDAFSVNSRDTVRLRDVELIVKDLMRKQELLKKHDGSLVKNGIVGLLDKRGASVREDADRLMQALGWTHSAIRSTRNKQAALDHLIARLEANQILVSQSVNNYMPQRLKGVNFSGMTIRDAKVPYIFLSGGESSDHQEPVGRRVFTLVLMSVLVARRIFAPVTYDGSSTGQNVGREYDIVGEVLMPARDLLSLTLSTLDDVKVAADDFKVTPSAMTVRAMRLRMIDGDTANAHLQELAREYSGQPKPRARQPNPVNAVRKYTGRELSIRMLQALDAGKLSTRDFCRSVTLNKIKASELGAFRKALG